MLPSCAIVGAGRLGSALAAALPGSTGPFGRGADPAGADVVLLCVPDSEIAAAAAAVSPGPIVGHCSGATTLQPLLAAGHEALSVHPLMTVPRDRPADFTGAGAAVAGSSERALHAARVIAARLGMRPVVIADEDRVAYHAAAAIASNFLTTIEGAAERLGATAGLDRELLVPLVRASVEAWAELGAAQATSESKRQDRGRQHRASLMNAARPTPNRAINVT
jgi:predicted short-subunit dehydrogenase-like oxidoreductase (DUF2520 family)